MHKWVRYAEFVKEEYFGQHNIYKFMYLLVYGRLDNQRMQEIRCMRGACLLLCPSLLSVTKYLQKI